MTDRRTQIRELSRISSSVGVASSSEFGDPSELNSHATTRLQRAKDEGRDQVVSKD
jgi:PleD family two-component response regulator